MKMQHIILVSAYYPPHLGGQENAVQGLANSLVEAGHKVTVLTSAQGAAEGTLLEKGVIVRRFPGFVFGHAPIMPLLPFALYKATRSHSIVHVHIGQAFTPEVVWLISKLRGFRYVAQLHIDFEPSGPAGFLLPLYKRFVLKPVLQNAAAVITLNSKTHATVCKTYHYAGRALIMNNGLDDSFFSLSRPSLLKKPPDTLRLLFVGRFSKQKNLVTLLEALAVTKRQVHLDVVGDGDESPAIHATIERLKLQKKVSLHGRQNGRQVRRFYQTSHALIMPSLYEAQPLVLLEAMAAGIPIIGTRVIGVEDHIKDIGILVAPTVAGLVEGIEQYYVLYHALRAMVQKGTTKAAKLRWQRTVKNYEALYEEVLAH